MCLNLKTKPIWYHSDRRGLTVGDALCASVSGTGYDWRSDLEALSRESGLMITLDMTEDSDKIWTYSNTEA